MCADKNFVGMYLTDDAPDRKILYEDPELGFCILGHVNHGAKGSKPHDHGPTWAIYGQASGETIMSDWEMLSPPENGEPGQVKLVRGTSSPQACPISITKATCIPPGAPIRPS